MKRFMVTAFLLLLSAPAVAWGVSVPARVHGPANAPAGSAASTGPRSIGVIVQFKQPSTADLGARLLARTTDTSATATNRAHGLYVFRTPKTQTAEQYSAQLMLASSGIAYAEPDYIRHVAAYTAPTDPDFTDATTWIETVNGHSNYYLGGKHWWLDAMKAPSAWPIGQGTMYPTHGTAADIKVAVVDTGIFLSHGEFSAGTVTAGKDEAASYNPNTNTFTTDSDITPDPTSTVNTDPDLPSHGTAVAAAVGAEINGAGMVGIGYNPQVVGYKVAGPITTSWEGEPAGTVLILDDAIANAIYDATDAGCKIITMSLAGPGFSQTLQDAVTYAHSHNVVVCAAAGNDGDTTVNYPAACTYVTAVASVGRSGGNSTTNGTITRSSFSDYASGVNDLCAPGELFWSADRPGYVGSGGGSVSGYQFWDGTSFSTPAVAGALAYLWRAMPDLTNDQVVTYAENTAVDLGTSGRDDSYGYGLVDMQAAYNRLTTDYPTLAKPTIAATYVKPSAAVTWTASSGYNVSYQVSVDGTLRSTQTSTTYTLPGLTDGQHLISVLPTSTRNWNASSLATKTITVDGTPPVVSDFSKAGMAVFWSIAETNPYTVQAYVDTATPVTVSSNSLSIVGLSVGSHTLHVNATDAAGNSSGWVTWPFTSEPTPPAAPVVPSVVVTDALSATVSWPPVTGATSYDYTVNGGSVLSTSGPAFTVSGLTGGVTQVAVRSVAGTLTSTWTTATVTDNVVVPGTPAISAPATTPVARAAVSWPAASYARSYEWRLNGGTPTSTTATSALVTGLSLGANSISVRSLDNLTQSAWVTATVTYTVPAPVVPNVVVTDALSANVTWTPVSGAASYDYAIGGGSVLSTSGPPITLTGLTGGVTQVTVRTVNDSGDKSTWTTATVTDNVVVPGTPAISAPATTGVPNVAVSWPAASNALAYQYRLNGGAATTTTVRAATISGLSLGANSISVRSLDNLAQSAWATATVTYTVPAPVVSAPATVWATTATVTWSAVTSATSYEWTLDAGSPTSTTSTGTLLSGLTFGAHTFAVRALQGAYASVWTSATITYAQPATTTLTLSPSTATVEDPATSTTLSGLISAPAETFRLQSSANGTTWSDTGLSQTSTATPHPQPFTVPVSATMYFRLVFTGDARWAPATSNVATVTYLTVVQPPVVSSVVVTDALSAIVSWPPIGGAASYGYTVNGGSVLSTSGPSITLTGLTGGVTQVAVRTVDPSSRTSVWVTATVTDNVVVPGTPVISAPSTVYVPSVTVTWPPVADALAYQYRLDGGAPVTVVTPSAVVPLGTLGSHTIEVRATDNLAQSTWATTMVTYAATVQPPSPSATTLTLSGPAKVTYPSSAVVLTGFVGAPNVRVELESSYDGTTWTSTNIDLIPTTSPVPVTFRASIQRTTYFRLVSGGTAQWAAATSSPVLVRYAAEVWQPTVPSRAKHRVRFTVSEMIFAPTRVSAHAVIFRFYRHQKVKGHYKWVLKKSVHATSLKAAADSATYRVRTLLSAKGSYRVCAAYSGGGLYMASTSKARTLRVR